MHPMKVYPCGYAVHGPLIEALMQQDPGLLLVDTRYSPRSRIPGWSASALCRRFGERYRWVGATLGNVNYARGGPITLAAPERGITDLIRSLREGHSLILLCGCRDYASCHRRLIVEMLVEQFPAATITHPETMPSPGTVKCLSIRQPFAWLLTHPEVLVGCGVEPKWIEHRDWSTRYRGRLLIHAGSQVERWLFHADHTLDHRYWIGKFGKAGAALCAAMPQTQEGYATGAIVGVAELVDVVERSESPWFVGRYGLVFQKARPLVPPLVYPGRLMLFDVPLSVVASALEIGGV